MNYFTQLTPNLQSVSACLSGLNAELSTFFEKNTSSNSYIRLHSSTLGQDDLLAFSKAFLEGSITVGNYNDDYERRAAKLFASPYCLASNSGSSANLLAISALVQGGYLQPGDKVIVPALSWSTTVFPLVQYGLIPVYLDISLTDFNICVNQLKGCVLEHQPKALMLIHTYGNPADLDSILDVCKDNSILLIEDTCESMGATWRNQPVGSFGILGTYSSYFSHHICTLEGGLTVTSSKHLDSLMRSIRSHGWTRGTSLDPDDYITDSYIDPTFMFVNIGYNLRLSDPQASIGVQQLDKLERFVLARQSAAQRFITNIQSSSKLSAHISFPSVSAHASSSWFGFPMRFKSISEPKVRDLRAYLYSEKVESRPFLAGDFSLQPVNKKFKHLTYNNTPNISLFHNLSIALPCHQDINTSQVDYMCAALEAFLD